MRIGQLARKLDVTPTAILQYLEELGIDVDKGVNTKLVGAGIEKVEEKFGRIEMIDPLAVEETEIKEETIEEEENPVAEEVLDHQEDEDNTDTEELEVPAPEETELIEQVASSDKVELSTEPSNDDSAEVIRPEYVKLQGLKVVDKIELPEPKPKKEEVKEEEESIVEEPKAAVKEEVEKEDSHIITEADIKADMRRHYSEQRKNDRKPERKKRKPAPKKRTPLTYEEKLKKEQEQAKKKKIAREKELKEKKRKAYEERIKKVQPTNIQGKKTKKKKETTVEKPLKQKHKKESTSIWGKFVKWLNT